MPNERRVFCADECHRSVPDTIEQPIEGSGWQYLPITNRWRCIECWRALRETNKKKEPPSAV